MCKIEIIIEGEIKKRIKLNKLVNVVVAEFEGEKC